MRVTFNYLSTTCDLNLSLINCMTERMNHGSLRTGKKCFYRIRRSIFIIAVKKSLTFLIITYNESLNIYKLFTINESHYNQSFPFLQPQCHVNLTYILQEYNV